MAVLVEKFLAELEQGVTLFSYPLVLDTLHVRCVLSEVHIFLLEFAKETLH